METQSKSINTKKLFFSVIFFLITLGIFLYVSFPQYINRFLNKDSVDGSIKNLIGIFIKNGDKKSSINETVEKPSAFSNALKPIYGVPEKIKIDQLGIVLDVVPVGVDEKGYLETPEKWNEAGWFKNGAKPSEVGNLLINAHYDDNYGRPAAFWQLKNVKLGDTVSVLDSYGRYYNYEVSNVYYVDINDPERSKVFEPYEKDKSVMTLITCGGVWVAGERTYSKRLVVNAELIQ